MTDRRPLDEVAGSFGVVRDGAGEPEWLTKLRSLGRLKLSKWNAKDDRLAGRPTTMSAEDWARFLYRPVVVRGDAGYRGWRIERGTGGWVVYDVIPERVVLHERFPRRDRGGDASEETFRDVVGEKDKWVRIDAPFLARHPDVADEVLGLLNTAYARIGGHLKFRTSADLRDNVFWISANDLDRDPEADAALIGKRTGSGIKMTGIGHDDSERAKKEAVSRAVAGVKGGEMYAEVSGAMATVLLKAGVDIVRDRGKVERVLGKRVEWVGSDPDGRLPGDAWYYRDIAGSRHAKIMVGRPK